MSHLKQKRSQNLIHDIFSNSLLFVATFVVVESVDRYLPVWVGLVQEVDKGRNSRNDSRVV